MREYDFKCPSCDERSEHYCLSNDVEDGVNPPLCPECQVPLKRIFSFGTFVFKGGKPSNDARYSKEKYLT